MGRAVALRNGGEAKVPIYQLNLVRGPDNDPVQFGGLGPIADSPSIDPIHLPSAAILLVNWSDIACTVWAQLLAGFGMPYCLVQVSTRIVGDKIVDRLLSDSRIGPLLLQTPIHLIGHSRGSGVVSRVAQRLGELGIWTNHLTYLDPQPLTFFADDQPANVWDTVIFAEDYRQNLQIPMGENLPGTSNWDISVNLCPSSLPPLSPPTSCVWPYTNLPHSKVHAFYFGTIAPSNDDGDGIAIDDAWYPLAGRFTTTGYYFARTAQRAGFPGTRPSAGISNRFPGGAANRIDHVATPVAGSAYPNVLIVAPTTYTHTLGQSVLIPFVAQDFDSPYDVYFELDDDTNPFNGSANGCTATLGPPRHLEPTTGPQSCTQGSGCEFSYVATTVGSCYIRTRATDGVHTRYDYTFTPVTVSESPPSAAVTSFAVPENYAINQDYQQQLGLPGASTLAVTTSGKLSPYVPSSCGAGDVGDYIEITDQTGNVIRRLSGTWNQTFNVAGASIRVRFHSNCYTYGLDGLIGPATVSVVATSDSPRDFAVPTNYGIGSDYEQVLFAANAQALTVTTSGKLSPYVSSSCGTGDVGDYIEITDQTGNVIRRLNGTWNQTFNVAGASIRVRFHSNCYTYGLDGLIGPATVDIAPSLPGAPDTVPDAFAFSSVANATPNSAVTSDSIAISGINTSTSIIVSNGFYRVNNGPLSALPGTIYPGDRVAAVGIAPSAPGETSSTIVTIGGVAGTFSVSSPLSGDPDLRSLLVSTGTLLPAFSSGVLKYQVNVAYDVTSIAFTPTADESSANVTVNGTGVPSGSTSVPIGLAIGNNAISIVVKAQGGATRTYGIDVVRAAPLFRAYLSGTGNDANPCTLQQPCRLLPAALEAISNGGEIWLLDSANYNTATVNIGKSVTILAIPGSLGSVVANGGDAIKVDAAGARVVLRNLALLNFGGGVNGVDFLHGAEVTVEDCEIYGMSNAAINASAPDGRLNVLRGVMRDNAAYGVSVLGSVTATLAGVHIINNALAGLVAGGDVQATVSDAVIANNATFGVSVQVIGGATGRVTVENSVLRANAGAGIEAFADGAGDLVQIMVSHSSLSGNGSGVFASTNAGGTVEFVLSGNVITNNSTGVNVIGSGTSVIRSREDNSIKANVTDVAGAQLLQLPSR
jgi:hypothetical protein